MKRIEGKRLLVRVIGLFEKSRVREIGVPPAVQSGAFSKRYGYECRVNGGINRVDLKPRSCKRGHTRHFIAVHLGLSYIHYVNTFSSEIRKKMITM